MGARPYTGKLRSDDFRHDRAVKARAAQDTTDRHIQKLVDRAPELTPEQRDRLAVLLRNGAA